MADTLTSDELKKVESLVTEALDNVTYSAGGLNALFGFVPLYEQADNAFRLYIRLGGPEIAFSKYDVDREKNVFIEPERDSLVHALSVPEEGTARKYSYTKDQVKEDYPLRITYKGGYHLQYSKNADSPYVNLQTNNAAKAQIVGELLTTTIEYLGLLSSTPQKSDIQLLLKAGKTEQGVGAVFKVFMDTLSSDLDSYLTSKINRTRYNSPDSLRKNFVEWRASWGYQVQDLYVEAFLRRSFEGSLGTAPEKKLRDFENTPAGKITFQAPFNTAKDVVLNSVTLASQSDQAVADNVKNYIDLFGMSSEADLASINTLTKANANLRKELEAVKATVPSNPNLPKYLGVGAGLVSGYFAIQQDSAQELETWQKGAIVAASGLLGAVPYLNFVTIATMPYLVNKGVQLSGDDEFKASARARMAQARRGAGRIATGVGEGARRLTSRQPQLVEES